MNFLNFLLPYTKSIKFWLFLFFIIRLYGITNPPLESASNWRQCDGLMIARNFYERDATIFYPRVDVAGDKTGIVGCEFPILNYSIYLVSLIFGFHDWYGRLINLVLSTLGAYFFYKLIDRYFTNTIAFYSTITLVVSLWFSYSRITIPDIFGGSLCIIALYHGCRYLDKEGSLQNLLLYFACGLIGCLAKISASSILTILIIPILVYTDIVRKKVIFLAISGIIIAITATWYFIWVPYLNSHYEFPDHFFMGMPIKQGMQQLWENLPKTLEKFYDAPMKYIGFVVFITSLVVIIKRKMWLHLAAFSIPFLAYFVVILKSGWCFYVNSYYPLMFIPAMAFIVGTGLSLIERKTVAIILLTGICIEGIANQVHNFQIRDHFKPVQELQAILDSVKAKRTDLIAINTDDGTSPTAMYFAHRRGWVVPNETLAKQEQLDFLKTRSCKYILIQKKLFGADMDLPLEIVYNSDLYKIYKL